MAFDLNDAWGWIQKLIRRVERIESGAMLENSSITNGRMRFIGGLLRVDSGGRVDIEGTLQGIGSLLWDGIVTLTSTFTAKGVTRFEGDTTQVGPFHVSGATDVTGNFTAKGATKLEGPAEVTGTLDVKGKTTLANDFEVTTGGRIKAGNTYFNPNGTISATTLLTIQGSAGISLAGTTTVAGNLNATNKLDVGGALTVSGAKSFRMVHPLDPALWLQHGSTESPVSGIEYWGESILDEGGSAVIKLPEYFDALAKPDARTVFVTGRGYSPDWSDINGNAFTVTGSAGGRFSWLVKAERYGGDFEVEHSIQEEILDSTQPQPST